MGHYASEMLSDDDWECKQRVLRERRARIAHHIKADIEARGIEYVLADIVSDKHLMSHYDKDVKLGEGS